MKTSIDVCRQTSKFYAQANTLLRNFRYCSGDIKCMLFRSFCTNTCMYCSYCSPFNSTSASIKKLKTSYNGVLRRLLFIRKPYSDRTMFVTHEFLFWHCCANVFSIFLNELVLVLILSYGLLIGTHCIFTFTHQTCNGGDQIYFNHYF